MRTPVITTTPARKRVLSAACMGRYEEEPPPLADRATLTQLVRVGLVEQIAVSRYRATIEGRMLRLRKGWSDA